MKKCFRIISLIIISCSCLLVLVIRYRKYKEERACKPGLLIKGIYEKHIKRLLDIILSFVALVLLSPVIGIVAIAVRLKLGSPVIFSQERPGMIDNRTGKERIFVLYKFRTMTDDRDKDGNLLPDECRLTGFGKWLRSTSLDELPELINIIKGDMSIVGPRPLLIKYLPYYTDEERCRHSVRPGLTGLSQINGRNNLGWDDRLKLDVDYVENVTFLGDCKIIISTVKKVIMRNDIASGEELVMEDFDVERKL